MRANDQHSVLDIHLATHIQCAGDLEISESIYLRAFQKVVRQRLKRRDSLQLLVDQMDVHQLIQEPAIDLRKLMDLRHGITYLKGFFYDEYTFIGWRPQ